MEALLEKRASILDTLEKIAVMIKQKEGEPDGYRSAYYLEERGGEDVLNSSALYLPSTNRNTMRLSELGKCKCLRLFRMFDDDRDGVWSFDEFKTYLSVMRVLDKYDPLTQVLKHREKWSMYMNDAYDTDARGNLTLQGFYMFCEATECSHRLTNDLLKVGLHWLWDGLQRHIELQDLFDAYDVYNEGKLPISKMQYLLGESAVITTQTQVDSVMALMQAHFACMDAILQRNRAIRRFGYRQISRVDINDKEHIYRDAFVALRLSSWEPPKLPTWSRVVQATKVLSFGYLRQVYASISKVSTWIRRASLTGLLKLDYLLPSKDDRSDYVVKIDVGNEFANNAEIQVVYMTDCDSSASLHELGYRSDGAECFVYLDFVTAPDISEVDLHATIAAMAKLVEISFADHFEAMPFFCKSLVVSPPKNQSHGSIVVRVVFLFSDGLDPFNVLLDLGFPQSIQIDHFLSRLRWTTRTNVSLNDVLTNKRFNLAKHLCLRSVLNVCLGRHACGQTIEQACYQAQYEADEEARVDQILNQERKQRRENNRSANTDVRQSISWREQRKRVHSERVASWCKFGRRVADFFKYSKTANINISVPSVSSWFHRDSVVHKLFHRDDLAEILRVCTTPGEVSSLWGRAYDALVCQLDAMAQNITSPIPEHATPEFAGEYHVHKSLLQIYETLTSNLVGPGVIRAEAGTVGVSVVIEGLNIFPLLPKVKLNPDK
ncbi:hypothetical protein LEN26_002784 [Aphanomyces euteiches]|nr:hypothetical protein LEN26_002784 [Aphanomyces euteiches]